MQLGRDRYYIGRRRERGPVLPFFLSAAVVVAGIYTFIALRPTIGGTVTDVYTGEPLAGVTLTLGGQRAKTDGQGRFTLAPVREPTMLVARAPEGYAPAEQELRRDSSKELRLALRPTVLSGRIVRNGSDAPLPGIVVRAVNAAGVTSPEVTTDEQGRYALTNVPEGARLVVEGPGFGRKEVEIEPGTTRNLALRPDTISGTVKARNGAPLPGATVAARGVSTTAKPDGSYTLTGVPEGAPIVVKDAGYKGATVDPGDLTTLHLILDPLVVKSIYLTPESIIKDHKFNALLALADRSEINAMVIDFKDEEGWVWHDSKVALAREIGAVHPSYDVAARLKTLKEHGVYTIARVVCMLDPSLAHARPELAVRNSKTGGIWKNYGGAAWVNAMRPEVWRYNTEIALEAADLGFDEVQFDYVRFPSDGDLDAIEVGAPYTPETRSNAIYNFLKGGHEALSRRGVALSADIFGIALWDRSDVGIGQQLEKIAPVVDYICPMIYPSHYYPGAMGLDLPNDHPYEVILMSLEEGGARIDKAGIKFRPWLQDFSYGRGIEYGPEQVRAQMKATYDFGSTGWMLWNANNTFTEGALLPESR